ncbi:hypothetical protein Tco_0169023 [Tanacetum coccineum]
MISIDKTSPSNNKPSAKKPHLTTQPPSCSVPTTHREEESHQPEIQAKPSGIVQNRVNTVKDKNVNTVRPKAVVNAARPKAVVNAVKGNNVNAVKASAYWVWKPKTKVLDHDNPQMDLQDQGVIDSGCSRHMTRNMSYLTDYEEIDGGYVAFGGKPKGGKIIGKDLVDGKKIIITESIVRRDLQLEDTEGVYCVPNATIFEQLTLMGPKKKDTKVPQPSGPTTNVADEAVNEEIDDNLVRAATTASSLEVESENVSKLSNDPLLARGNTLQSGLKRRVKKLERRNKSRTHGLKRLYKVGSSIRVESFDEEGLGEEDASKQGRIADIDVNKDIYLVNVHTDEDMFGVNDLDGDEVIVDNVDVVSAAKETVNAATTISDVEITLAQALAELKSAKPKADKDKGKGIMIKEPVVEQVKPMKRLKQIRLDEELAFKLQAKIEADYQLAQRLQAQEQEELTDEEKARLPPTRAQQRNIICTYLKNMEGWKPKSLKNKSFANIQELFDKAMKRVNTFVDYRTELVEENSKKVEAEIAQERSSKRAGEELEQESSKKQKVEEDKETTELQSLIEIVLDEEEVEIDDIPLATKPPTIVDWKIHKEGKNSYYQIIRADGSSKMYKVFSQMLKSFDSQDLEDLYKLVKAKYGSTRLVEDLDLILYGDLKTMFDPHVEDRVWRNQQDYRVLD